MKIFRKSRQQSIVEESNLTLRNDGEKDLEELLFYTAQFVEETKRQINRTLVRTSIDSLMPKVDIIFEISRLQNLVEGWVIQSRYALFESFYPINDMKSDIKNSLQDTKRRATRIYFLLNKLKDGDIDRQFLWRLQAKGLIDLEENEIHSCQENDLGKYWTLTIDEKQEILTMMRERAMPAVSENKPKTILQKMKSLSCIAKSRRRVSESGPKDTVAKKRAKSSDDCDKNESIPEMKRRNFRRSVSDFCRAVSAFFTA